MKTENRVVLLGCGAVGNVVARHLAASPSVDSLLAADVDIAAAKGLAASTHRRKVRPLRLDVGDGDALRDAVRRARLVIHAALPKYNLAVMEAALEAGADYMDLAGGGEEQLALDTRWRREGRTALLGMGEDPGLGNVFARHAADGMDEVVSVRIRDGETAYSAKHPFISLFSPEVFVQETIGPATVYEDGVWRRVPPFSGREEYPFPAPVGTVPVYHVYHEEVETIPKFLGKRPRSVDFKLALLPRIVRTLRRVAAAGIMQDPRRRRAFLATIPSPASLAGKVTGYASILVEVAGRADGHAVTHTVWTSMDHARAARRHGTSGTAWITGTGAAVGALVLLERAETRPGVLVTERLDPAAVFARLRGRDVTIRERIVLERRLT